MIATSLLNYVETAVKFQLTERHLWYFMRCQRLLAVNHDCIG